MTLSLAAVPADAATGFTYKLVRDFPATTSNDPRLGQEEALCNFAFNDRGQAAYTAARIEFTTNPQVTVTSLYFWDGTSEQLVYRDAGPRDGVYVPDFGGCPGYGIGLNDSGLIAVPALTRSGNVPGIMYFRPGQGLVGTVESPAGRSVFWSRANVNDAGQVAYFTTFSTGIGVSCIGIGTAGPLFPNPGESQFCGPAGDLGIAGSSGVPPGAIVNGSGQAAILVSQKVAGSSYSTSLLDHDPTGGGTLTSLGPAEEWFVHSAVPGFNGSGFASVVTDGPVAFNHAGSRFRVALVSPDRQSVSILTDGSVFTRDPHTGRTGAWLNDRNQVAFVVQDLDPANPSVGRQGLWLVDPAKEPLAVLLGGYEPFEFAGQVASAVYLWTDSYPGGRGDLVVNNAGDVMFSATYVPAGVPTSTLRHGIFVARPEPGLTPANPVMPGPGDTLPFGWRFTAPCAAIRTASFYPPGSAVSPPRTCWVDPAFASGYTFSAEPGSANFASVLIPAPLPGGDGDFTLEVDGLIFPIQAGQVFDLTTIVQTGVPSFRITGIDLAEALSPTDPSAFVTGLTWVGAPTAANSFTMVPIADSDGDGVEDAIDTCPGTAPGSSVDATGCSLAQHDSDGDGVKDDVDACPGTPAGTAVNSVGCPLPPPDSDGDGVPDSMDACSGTAPGATVDANGCSAAQRDSDGDGVKDDVDACPGTPPGTAVNSLGCPLAPPDSDGDGVPDSSDACPGTAPGAPVDATGCPIVSSGRVCDVDRDEDVDWRDIKAIAKAVGQTASGPTDPRDANRSGRIELKDVLICSSRCDRWLCASP